MVKRKAYTRNDGTFVRGTFFRRIPTHNRSLIEKDTSIQKTGVFRVKKPFRVGTRKKSRRYLEGQTLGRFTV